MFQSFDSFEEMQAAMAENERLADEAVVDWQREIKPGNCVMRFEPDMGIWIFTDIIDPVESERAYCDANSLSDREHMAELEQLWAPGGFKKNRRFGRHFSEMCPEGELGELHICTVAAIIPRYVFDLATNKAEPVRDGLTLARAYRDEITLASHHFKGT